MRYLSRRVTCDRGSQKTSDAFDAPEAPDATATTAIPKGRETNAASQNGRFSFCDQPIATGSQQPTRNGRPVEVPPNAATCDQGAEK